MRRGVRVTAVPGSLRTLASEVHLHLPLVADCKCVIAKGVNDKAWF
jgi:hypothetical protein